jgi:hypothetical protein
MDASVGYYAGGRLKAQVADIFAGDSLSRALFVVKRGNPRFDWGNYLLTTNFATPELDYRDHKVFFDFDTALFDTVSAFGTLGLYQGSQPLKKIWGVELDKPDNWQVYYKKRPGSLGRSQVPHGSFPDRHLLHWRTEPQDAYVVQATQRFRAPTNGVMILRYSKSAAAGSYASLFETKNENGAASPKALQMAKAITASIELSADPKARRRFGEIYLLPVKKDGVYGVFLTSQNVTEQYTGDWGVYYMPW